MIDEQKIRDIADYLATLDAAEAFGELLHMDRAAAGVILRAVQDDTIEQLHVRFATLATMLAVTIGAGSRIANLHNVHPARPTAELHSCTLLGRLFDRGGSP